MNRKFFAGVFCALLLMQTADAAVRVSTVRGIAQATKDGLMVDGMLIPEAAIPKRYNVDALIGKTVRITGIVTHVPAAPPPPPPPAPQEQMRAGPYDEMRVVQAVQVE